MKCLKILKPDYKGIGQQKIRNNNMEKRKENGK
jgi:hypothetical protein